MFVPSVIVTACSDNIIISCPVTPASKSVIVVVPPVKKVRPSATLGVASFAKVDIVYITASVTSKSPLIVILGVTKSPNINGVSDSALLI